MFSALKIRIDKFLVVLLAAIAVASVLPVRGQAAAAFGYATQAAIALLFFLYGAKLSTRAVIEGLAHWRLQGLVFFSTFVLFPILGEIVVWASGARLSSDLRTGLLFLSLLPSTVQSSIAFTSIARGNVPAALTSASLSNLSGVFVTPALVVLAMGARGGIDARAVFDIALQILAPFVAGQIARRWIGDWLAGHKTLTSLVDRGSIVMVVYGAFSEGMAEGVWSRVDLAQMLWLAFFCVLLLALVMAAVAALARLAGFNREDRIAILFCGSKKSLATGAPMAGVLFAGQSLALIVLPLMVFHQIQLFVCAILAQRFAEEKG